MRYALFHIIIIINKMNEMKFTVHGFTRECAMKMKLIVHGFTKDYCNEVCMVIKVRTARRKPRCTEKTEMMIAKQ